jgi:hypothetical protein
VTTCPSCGADVPPKARACPECGSDEQTGWSEEAASSGLDLPDPDFNYEEFVQSEFGAKKPMPRGIKWYWWVVAALLAAGMLLAVLR